MISDRRRDSSLGEGLLDVDRTRVTDSIYNFLHYAMDEVA